MNKKELLEKRGDALKTQDDIWAKAKAENRGLTTEEQTQYDVLDATLDSVDADLERITKRERRNVVQVSHNNEGEQGEKNAIAKRFSITEAIQGKLNGRMSGLVREMHEQAVTESSHVWKRN
jgi:hypothetical protein